MITTKDFMQIICLENDMIHAQTADLSHADTLIQPVSGGNCMNWVLGHLLETRLTLLEALGGEPPLDPAKVMRYRRDSEPVRCDGPGVLSLESLLNDHDLVHTAVMAQLLMMDEADFDTENQVGERQVTRGWRVFFLQFHSNYHIGQLEQLRQLAGRTEKVV